MLSNEARKLLCQLRDETKHLEELLACGQDFTGSLRRVGEYAELATQRVNSDHPVASFAELTLPGAFDLRRQLGRAPTAAEYRATRGR
jgi:hypothetical protein